MQTSSALTLREGVLLGQALVASVARGVGARLLIIKGPRQVELGLRPARDSVDADALVHPDDFDTVAEALTRVGWRRRFINTSPKILPFHSISLAHERWPCEIDLHHHFPGFLAADDVAFGTLWRHRQIDFVAQVPVAVCDLAGDTLIAALHAARAPNRNRHDMDFIVRFVRDRFDESARRDLAELAEESGSADTLSAFLEAVDAPTLGIGKTDRSDLQRWFLFTAQEGIRGISWLHHLQQAPWRRRPRLLWRAVFLNEPELREQYPQAPAGWWGLTRAQWWRWRATARHLPRAVKALRSTRG